MAAGHRKFGDTGGFWFDSDESFRFCFSGRGGLDPATDTQLLGPFTVLRYKSVIFTVEILLVIGLGWTWIGIL